MISPPPPIVIASSEAAHISIPFRKFDQPAGPIDELRYFIYICFLNFINFITLYFVLFPIFILLSRMISSFRWQEEETSVIINSTTVLRISIFRVFILLLFCIFKRMSNYNYKILNSKV